MKQGETNAKGASLVSEAVRGSDLVKGETDAKGRGETLRELGLRKKVDF